MDSSIAPKLDISVSKANLEEDAKKIIAEIRPEWDLDSLKFKVRICCYIMFKYKNFAIPLKIKLSYYWLCS